MKRRVWRVFYVVVMGAYAAFQMWRSWGKPEFWPLVALSLVLSLIVIKAGKDRKEDLEARLPGARTFGH